MNWYRRQEINRLLVLAVDPSQATMPPPNPIQEQKQQMPEEQSRSAGYSLAEMWLRSLAQSKFTGQIVKDAVTRALASYNIEQQSKTKNKQQILQDLNKIIYLEAESTFFASQIASYIKRPDMLVQINEMTRLMPLQTDPQYMSKVLIDRLVKPENKGVNQNEFYVLGYAMEKFKDTHRQDAAAVIYRTVQSVVNELPKNVLDKLNKVRTNKPQDNVVIKRVAQDFLDAVANILRNQSLFPKDVVNAVNALKTSPINKWLKTLNPKDIYGPSVVKNVVTPVSGYGTMNQTQVSQTPQAPTG